MLLHWVIIHDLPQKDYLNENALNIQSKGKAKNLMLSFAYQSVLVCHCFGPACGSQGRATLPLMSLFLAMPNLTSLLCPMGQKRTIREKPNVLRIYVHFSFFNNSNMAFQSPPSLVSCYIFNNSNMAFWSPPSLVGCYIFNNSNMTFLVGFQFGQLLLSVIVILNI